MSAVRWQMLREIAADLTDRASDASGSARVQLAAQAARDARTAIELVPGPEAAGARDILAAIERALREVRS